MGVEGGSVGAVERSSCRGRTLLRVNKVGLYNVEGLDTVEINRAFKCELSSKG